jgi:hypothetical protein
MLPFSSIGLGSLSQIVTLSADNLLSEPVVGIAAEDIERRDQLIDVAIHAPVSYLPRRAALDWAASKISCWLIPSSAVNAHMTSMTSASSTTSAWRLPTATAGERASGYAAVDPAFSKLGV